jgi:putative intracellular protease/amidase
MSRRVDAATAGLRLVLAVVVGGAAAHLVPSVLATTMEAPPALALAALALAVAAMVCRICHGATSVPRVLGQQPGNADEAPWFLSERVTDPLHHPLRPRAPGLV